jgi:hypothetical protein
MQKNAVLVSPDYLKVRSALALLGFLVAKRDGAEGDRAGFSSEELPQAVRLPYN